MQSLIFELGLAYFYCNLTRFAINDDQKTILTYYEIPESPIW